MTLYGSLPGPFCPYISVSPIIHKHIDRIIQLHSLLNKRLHFRQNRPKKWSLCVLTCLMIFRWHRPNLTFKIEIRFFCHPQLTIPIRIEKTIFNKQRILQCHSRFITNFSKLVPPHHLQEFDPLYSF